MVGQRKQYAAEFKREAVRLVTEQGLSMAHVARDLDINDNLLSRWYCQINFCLSQIKALRTHTKSIEALDRMLLP